MPVVCLSLVIPQYLSIIMLVYYNFHDGNETCRPK